MRLWSIHPKYLDRMGLLGLWREAVLAKRLLFDEPVGPKAKHYLKHPQMIRFQREPKEKILSYLYQIYLEGYSRGYKFQKQLLFPAFFESFNEAIEYEYSDADRIPVTVGQIFFEYNLLRERVWDRNLGWYLTNLCKYEDRKVNPIFKVIEGPKENWEKSQVSIEWQQNQNIERKIRIGGGIT